MFKLSCKVQNYAWGKVGNASKVAELMSLAGGKVEEADPYAEYWFGTHPNGPSSITTEEGEEALKDWLARHPEAGGACETDGSLPFLFKVLSVGKALSIQAHPNKPHAEKLHAARPDVYKDPNHKPEMACALTDFEAMCGFRTPSEIAGFLKSVPEFRTMVGDAEASKFEAAVESAGESKSSEPAAEVKTALQSLFTALMNCEPAGPAGAIAERLAKEAGEGGEAALPAPHNIVLRLTKQYPLDVGVVAPYLLNTITLSPGQAIYLAANEPHAYLSGDCVEVMACSDNVVRAGLTPKLRDVPTLCQMLSYTAGPPNVLEGDYLVNDETNGVVRQYSCAAPEFTLQYVNVKAGGSIKLPASVSARVVLVLSGKGTTSTDTSLAAGDVLLEDARAEVTVSVPEGGEDLSFYRVHTNPDAE